MPVVDYTVVNGELLSENRAGVKRDYVADSLGSTVALLDSTQTKTDTFTYWPYGEVKTRTGTTATPFQFVGTLGYYRDSTSRDYVRARYLRKDLSRWQTQDPIGLRDGHNLYGYVGSNSVTWSDPTGTITKKEQKDLLQLARDCGFDVEFSHGHIKLKKEGVSCPPIPGVHAPDKDRGAAAAVKKCVLANCTKENPEETKAYCELANRSDGRVWCDAFMCSTCIVVGCIIARRPGVITPLPIK